MMEATGSDLGPIGADPYMEPVSYQTMQRLSTIEEHLYRLANFTERAREKEAPTLIDLSPASGQATARTFQTTTKLRVLGIVLGGAAGDNLRLSIGQRPYNFFNVTGALIYIPFPIEIARGLDMTVADITTPASLSWNFQIIAYTL